MHLKQPLILASLVIAVLAATASPTRATISTFNALTPVDNVSTRNAWLAAAGIATPQYLVNFETGFSNLQNVHNQPLFPGGLIMRDTGPGTPSLIIRTGAGVINGSNPVGTFSVTQDEQAYFELDFSAHPVDYVGFLDIDQAGTSGLAWFEGISNPFSFETTGTGGATAEFFGIWHNNMPRITKVQLDASGDGLWGMDNIEYGTVPEPTTLTLLALAGTAGIVARRKRKS